MIEYNQLQPSSKALEELFINCGLEDSIKDVALESAFNNSIFVNYAWDGDKTIGAIRCIGDGVTVLYIEDILVDKNYQGKKIGTNLLQSAMNTFDGIPKIVLRCGLDEQILKFVKKFGFIDEEKYGKKTLVYIPKKKNFK